MQGWRERIVGTATQAHPSPAFCAARIADHHGERARAAGNQPVQEKHGPNVLQKKARPKPGFHCVASGSYFAFSTFLASALTVALVPAFALGPASALTSQNNAQVSQSVDANVKVLQ